MNWREQLRIDANVCHGRICIKGTRVFVSVILDNLGAGESPDEIMRGYHVEREDIEAAMHYAGELARERIVPLAPGAG